MKRAIEFMRRRSDLVALFVLLLLVLVLFHRAVFSGEALFERDLGFWYYPQVESIVRIVASGSWPLWDPYMAFGVPLLANPSTQILYPFTALHLVLEPWTFYTLYVVGHLVFSGAGQYFLARRLGLSALASFVAGSAWMASGPLLSLANMWHHFSGAAWIPWVFLAAERACETFKTRDLLLWGGVIAGQILTGSADMCAIAALGSMATVLRRLRWSKPRDPSNVRWLSAVALAWTFALAVTAAQWLPALEMIRGSQRSGQAEVVRTHWSVHPLALFQSAIPVVTKGLPLAGADPQVTNETEVPLLYSLYLGAGVLGLAASGLAGPRRPRRRFFAFVFVAAVLVALGRHSVFYGSLVALLPPLTIVRFPVKALILTPLACGILAGMGIDAWRRPDPELSKMVRWTRGAMILLACGCGLAGGLALAGREGWLALPLRSEPWLSEILTATAGRALTAGVAVIALALLVRRCGRPVAGSRWLAHVAAAVAIGELVSAHLSLNPTAPARLFAERTATVAAIAADGAPSLTRLYTFDYFWPVLGKKHPEPHVRDALNWTSVQGPPGLGRVLGLRMLYPASGRWGLASSFDRDNLGLNPPHMRALVAAFRATEETPHFARLLAMASVRYVLALHSEGLEDLTEVASVPSPFPLPIRIFRVRDPLPHAYAVGRGRLLEGGQLVHSALVDDRFDARREILLTEGPAIDSEGFAGAARTLERKPDRVVVEADFNRPGYLVVTDAYDPGWKATVDGLPAAVFRANIAFRAVPVLAGRHVVEQVYRPWGVRVGVSISALTLLGCVGMVAQAGRNGGRSGGESNYHRQSRWLVM